MEREDCTISVLSMRDKLIDINKKTSGLYTIKLTDRGMILKNFNNAILITEDPMELSEAMYRIILKENGQKEAGI